MNPVLAKPPIAEVVGRYTTLRRSGRELVGLCPLHQERTPSFRVNERGVFHCFGCGAGGDVIRFIELVEGVDFKAALKLLDVEAVPATNDATAVRHVGVALARWAVDMAGRLSTRMREVGETDESAWALLETLQEDLMTPALVPELWREREAVERIAGNAEDFPSMAAPYVEQLRTYAEGSRA